MNVSFDFDGTLHRDGRPLWPAMGFCCDGIIGRAIA